MPLKTTFSDPLKWTQSNCYGTYGGQKAIPRDQRLRMGGCVAVGLVYRKLLHGEANQPVVALGSMETDEERVGAFLLSAISCDCEPC